MAKAVVLARGLGTRMREGSDETRGLTPGQAAVAASGVKAMMPIGPRPFLDFALTRLADAGCREVCLVIGPEHFAIRRYYAAIPCHRLTIRFAIQARALGTANAVAAAAAFVGEDPFLVVNGDNLYPVSALRALNELGECGLVGFDREGLIRTGNIEPGRIARFAAVEVGDDGYLTGITEKPDPPAFAPRSGPTRVSMNAWRFDARIFEAIGAVMPSVRGELELPEAVQVAMTAQGCRFRVIDADEAVLDLTSIRDVRAIERRLEDGEIAL
jgi:glucose-1-phosphate thymidylyltransferase